MHPIYRFLYESHRSTVCSSFVYIKLTEFRVPFSSITYEIHLKWFITS